MRRTWPLLLMSTGLAGCGSDPAARLIGRWSHTMEPIPGLPAQRTVFRFEKGHAQYVEHWLKEERVSVDTNWYALSPDGRTLDVTGRYLHPDTMHLQVQRCTADTLELTLDGGPPLRLLRDRGE